MKKYLYYLLGMNILVLGITCNTLSDLGVGAFSTLPYAVSFLTFLIGLYRQFFKEHKRELANYPSDNIFIN